MRERVAAFRFVKEGYRLDSWWAGFLCISCHWQLAICGDTRKLGLFEVYD